MARLKLTETRLSTAEILERDSRRLREGTLSRVKYNICNLGELNRNKRVYEKAVFEKVLADPDIKEKLEKRSLYAHAEHPEGMQSSTEKIAGVVTEIQIVDNNVYAIMEVLDTPYGRICDSLLRAGCGLGTSTRAEGELEEVVNETDGEKHFRVVPDSYKFVTVDWTADPSTYGSFPESVERDLTKIVKDGWESKKIDQQYATCLLEKMKCKEAMSLCESIKESKKCSGCGEEGKTLNKDGVCHQCSADKKNEQIGADADRNSNVPSFNTPPKDPMKETILIDDNMLEFLRSECSKDPMFKEFKKTQTASEAFEQWMKEKVAVKMVSVIPETTTSGSSATQISLFSTSGAITESGPHTVDLKDILKEFEKIEILTATKKLTECKTIKEKTDAVYTIVKSLKETVSILEAEKEKLIEIADGDLTGLRKSYARDVVDFNKKCNILREELENTIKTSAIGINALVEKTNGEKVLFAQDCKEDLERKITIIEKTALDATKKIYESKFKELEDTFNKKLKESKAFYNGKLMKLLVTVKVKEASLENELLPKHLALLESLTSEDQIEAKLDEIRLQLREGSFHSNDFKAEKQIIVNINERQTEGQQESQASVNQMLHLAKSLK